MKINEVGTVLLVTLVVVGLVGFGSSLLLGKKDGAVEELSEEIIENQLEDMLGLPEDTLDIDLTPGSEEKG